MSLPTVIVGAGSAGCVLANRLSADSDRRVLLLEAGPDYPPCDPLPDDLRRGGRNSFTAHDWGYRHRPNTRQVLFPLPRGKVVGGSSAVNTCIALRGQPQDYDEWAAQGLSAWSWEKCLPAFRRLEHDLDFPNEPHHGAHGALPIKRHPPEEWTPWQAAFVEGCRELGYPDCPDSNAPGTTGVGPHAMNKVEGRRISAAEAYLNTDVRARDNFELRADTLVRRVLFDGRRATGVEVERRGRVSTIQAGEVFACSGAINTPALLLRSGVGPARDVERLGVEVVARNRAIGRRLLDHPGAAIFLRPRLFCGTSSRHDLIQTVCRYDSQTADLPNDMILQPGSCLPLPWFNLPLVSIMMCIGKPRGVGRLRIVSADPRAAPHVESRLLENAHDRKLAVDAILRAYEIARTPAARAVARAFYPSRRVLEDRERLEEKLFKICDSGYHPCGTAPMGTDDDDDAACDQAGRVRGTENLRVVDASLMPTIPSANIHLTVLMIAERIARLIIGESNP